MKGQYYFRTVQYRAPRLAQLSPEQGLVESNLSGQWLLYDWSPASGALRPLGVPGEIPFYAISPGGRSLFYFQDECGNDLGHYFCRPLDGGEAVDLTPDLPPFNSFGIVFSQNGARAGFTYSTQAGFTACVVDLDADERPGACREIYHTRTLVTCPWLSADGKLAVLASTHFSAEMAFGLVAVDVERDEEIATLWDGPGSDLNPQMRNPFSPVEGGPSLFLTSAIRGLRRPLLWNPLTGERHDLAFAEQAGDILPRGWSPDGRQILLEQIEQTIQRLGIYDVESGQARWLDLPTGVCWDAQFWKDGRIIAQWEALSQPPQVVAIDPAGGLTPLLSQPSEKSGQQADRTWHSITFPSSDSVPVQAWLALPGDCGGPFPTILEAHGGPTEVEQDRYHPEALAWLELAWLELAFAYALVNYRGSTTFGQAFQDQIIRDYGHWELEDLAACRAYLVGQGLADAGRVFLTGFCYGGFLTLMGLARAVRGYPGGRPADGAWLFWRQPR